MLCPTCLATMVGFNSKILPSTSNLSSLMHCPVYLATVVIFNSKILYSIEMCQERKGKKRKRERNGKERFSFLSRSSIFGHPFFPFLAKIMKKGEKEAEQQKRAGKMRNGEERLFHAIPNCRIWRASVFYTV